MKKLFVLVFSFYLLVSLQAQPVGAGGQVPPHHGVAVPPPPASHAPMLVLQASHGESFYVYVDGSLYQRNPMGRVEVKGLSQGDHDVYVVLHHPAQKIVYMPYRPSTEPVAYLVHYCAHENALKLVPQQHSDFHQSVAFSSQDCMAKRLGPTGVRNVPTQVAPPPMPRHAVATDGDMAELFGALKRESFDANRLTLARTAMESKLYTSEHIKRLASAFEFEANKVTFLIDAYERCFDQENYFKVVQVLNFSIDREKVLQKIQEN